MKAGPVVPKVVVPNNKDYPPLPPMDANPKSKTAATKLNTTTTTTTATDTTTSTAGAAAWLAPKRETLVPTQSAPKVELYSGLRLIYASGFPYAKPGDLRKAMQGARIRTSASGRDYRQSLQSLGSRPEAADKDKLVAISSFAAKTVTTIQRSPNVKARNFFRSLLASIGGKTLETATAEAAKIRVQTPDFSISTMKTVPKESLPVKKATDKEPAAPAVDSPLKWLLRLLQQSKMTVLLIQSPLSLTLKCICNE
ncbi:hypothetical protein BASA50_004482 [Batrachochytrium salamandrivorans]|uniref:Uncharacterized protein n=1 Tax=Batrachochytrium salamandrivorans TaxID=1357716 RepID=A0ABQ8FGK4_9FUNG|nr:hypothetical protein BASA50_004482 [Batrachochytrium salamandrivorans]